MRGTSAKGREVGRLRRYNRRAAATIGTRTPADLTCAHLPPGGPEPEGRGGGHASGLPSLAARPAPVRTRTEPVPQAFSEGATFDPSADAAQIAASFGAEGCPSAFVFQVSEREPALRVEYPAPLNAVAAFSALSPAQKSNRTIWWRLALHCRTSFDPEYAKRLQK